jgi:hypothetical protein
MGALWQEFLEGSAVHFYDGEYRPRSTLMTYEEEKEGGKKHTRSVERIDSSTPLQTRFTKDQRSHRAQID